MTKHRITFCLLLTAGLSLAQTQQLQIATVTRSYGRDTNVVVVLSNVVDTVQCADKRSPRCTNIVYLIDGKTNRFHTQNQFKFELRPQ